MANLTPQQELFAQKYITCKCNASEAYRQAYNPKDPKAPWVNNEAYLMLQNPDIALRIEELQAEAAERNRVTVDSITEELNDAKEFAKQEANPGALVSAIMGKAKIHGLDKLIIEGDLKMVKIKDMTGKK